MIGIVMTVRQKDGMSRSAGYLRNGNPAQTVNVDGNVLIARIAQSDLTIFPAAPDKNGIMILILFQVSTAAAGMP